MKDLERVLREHPFFRGLESKHVASLAECASERMFRSGDFLFREGEQADSCYLIRQGKVVLESFVPGKGPVTIQTAGEGDLLGLSWFIPLHEWRFDARALQPAVAVVLKGKCLRDKCEQDRDLGYELMKRFTSLVTRQLEESKSRFSEIR